MPEIGQEQVNKKTGAIRRWDGRQWNIVTPPQVQAAPIPPVVADAPVPPSPEESAISAVAAMPPWKRRLGITAVKGLQGATPEFLHPYLAPQGLNKVEELIQAGEEKASGEPFGILSTKVPEIAASLPLFGTSQAATIGLLSKIPGIKNVISAAQNLPGLFKRGAPWAAKGKGVLARGAGGAMAFPAIEAANKAELPSPENVITGGAMGALFGPGAFTLGKEAKAATGVPNLGGDLGGVSPSSDARKRILGQMAADRGVPLAPEEAAASAKVEEVASKVLRPEPAEPLDPGLGPLFGGPREPVAGVPTLSKPPSPMAGAQQNLFPPASTPMRYGPGRGLVETPPAPPLPDPRFGGNISRERLGTETALMKRQMRAQHEINRIRGLLEAK